MRHTYLRVSGATVKLVKTSPGTFTGEYVVGDVTYNVKLDFDFTSSLFAYHVVNGDEDRCETGFEAKDLAKLALAETLTSLTPTVESEREGFGELDDEGNEILAA